jgi:TPR repeat protein
VRAAVAAIVVATVACAPQAPVVVAARAPDPVCPLGGCARDRAAPPPAPSLEANDDPSRFCDDSSASACTERALELWDRRGERANAAVLALVDRACEFGDARGCTVAGRLHLERAAEADVRRGEAQLARACDGEEPIACDAIARRIEPTGEERRRARATRTAKVDAFERVVLESSCWRGGANACFAVGLYAERGVKGFAKDLALAARAYVRGCAAGEIVSCNNLANAVYYGDGVAQDFVRAAKLYEKACAAGEAVGCANVGFISEYGDGVPADVKIAAEMYRVGCAGGSSYSCVHGAMLEAYKKGVPHDPARAVETWKHACDANDAAACSYLAIMHEDGKGTPRDEDAARALMRKACERHQQQACAWIREQTIF